MDNVQIEKYVTLRFYEENDIAYLTLNMPPANKMIPEFLVEFINLVENDIPRIKAKALIISGEGRNFSSGADVEKLCEFIVDTCNKEGNDVPSWYKRIKQAFITIAELEIPVISVVKGCCIGSGFELAIHGHVVICEKGALIGLPEVTFGLLPGMNGTLKSFGSMGYRKGLLFFMKGELASVIPGQEYPFIDYVVPKGEGFNLAFEFLSFLKETGVYCSNDAKDLFWKFIGSKPE